MVLARLSAVLLSCVLSGFVLSAYRTQGAVLISGASGGTGISADTAATGGSGAWTSLGSISITEGTTNDIGAGTNLTLVLSIPAGYELNSNSVPSISFASGGDITAASVALANSSTISVTFTASGTTATNLDRLVIGASGLQVRPKVGGPLAGALHIYRPTSGGGSAVITGITNSANGSTGSSFGNLSEVAGNFAKLLLLMPGEAAAPGSTSGKTGVPSAQTAGTAFTVTVNGVDTNWNTVAGATGTNFTIRITSTDTNAAMPANADLSSGTKTFSITLKTAGTTTVTATDVDDGTKTPSTSPSTTVNHGAFNKLQVLLPGETAVPGSASGKSGTPVAQTAGVAYSVSVGAVDSNWNAIGTNDLVHITSSDTNSTLPPDAPLTNGLATFSLTPKTAGSRTVTCSNLTHTGIMANTSSAFTVNPARYAHLQVLMPGQSAAPGTPAGKNGTPTSRTAGLTFSNLTVRAVDAFWNLVASNATVTMSSSDPNAVLPPSTPLGATGSKTNFAVTFKTAGQQSISAVDNGDSTKTNTGSPTTVLAGNFVKLQLLVPGEVAAPGTASGKTGVPAPQQIQQSFTIVVNGVDANWNVVGTNDTIHFGSSDPLAILPADAPLISGTRSVSVTLETSGTNLTLTASDVTTPAISPGTSTPLVVKGLVLRGGPVVAIHDSELTRYLETIDASAPTPTGVGTSGKQWWPTNWHYFVMPESVKEALRSDGTPFEVVSDVDIIAGRLMDTNGRPRYPILVSLASEAVADAEIAQLTNYVAAGGFLLTGSSAFTRNTNGSSRADFAFANELGIHMIVPGFTNWRASGAFNKQLDHRLVSHIPNGPLFWEMPTGANENSWGTYPHPGNPAPQALMWQVQPADATVIANGDLYPYLLDKQFGKGHFIYHAAMQPLIAHGGWGCGMYAYAIFRKAIEWAFETAGKPLPRLSPWPYPYDAAFMVRHDLEDYSVEIANVEASAQVEFTNGVSGDYFFCTGTLRVDMSGAYNTNAVISGMQRAVSNYHATIGPHNGGLRNPFNAPPLTNSDFDFWHWGPDEALDVVPAGYPDGKTYSLTSVSNSFFDVESWLPGQMTNGMRVWAAPYFDCTREPSYDILSQLGVKVAGETKLTPFPHWTLSTQTSGKRYSFLSVPVSDWFVGSTVSQSMEAGHTTNSVHALVDFYYSQGALINLYSHTLSTGLGTAGGLAPEYLLYGLNTNLHPRVWPINSIGLYNWWLQRSNASMTVAYFATNANEAVATYSIAGAGDAGTTVELWSPDWASVSSLQVFTNGALAGPSLYRFNNQTLKVQVGTTVTNAEIHYHLGPRAVDDSFASSAGPVLNIPGPGVLTNDLAGVGGGALTATLVAGPTNGMLTFSNNGGFTYVPVTASAGIDTFTYRINDGLEDSGSARVTLVNTNPVSFTDDCTRASDPGPIAPWLLRAGNWQVTGGVIQGGTNGLNTYANIYLTNNWQDYVVEARMAFPSNAFGGAIGGRLNSISGAHYAAWIYPEGSDGASNVLRLIKFSNWTTWSPVAQVSLESVGTNFHTIKMAFHEDQIGIYFDGTQVLSVSDPMPYLSGGISLDLWTDQSPYVAIFGDIHVYPLVAGESFAVQENSILTVGAPGVLGNDTEVYGVSLSAELVLSPAHGSLSLGSDGSFVYTPETNFVGSDNFIYQSRDGVATLGSAWVGIAVNANATPPVLESVALSNGVTTVLWSSVAGRNYRLQYKEILSDTNWIDVVPDVSATGTTTTATNIVGSAQQRFYRVLLLP